MTAELSQSDVDAVAARIRGLGEERERARARIRQVSSQVFFRRVAQFSAVCAARQAAERFHVWRGGVLLLVPPVVGVVGFIAADFVTGHTGFSAPMGTLFGCAECLSGSPLGGGVE